MNIDMEVYHHHHRKIKNYEIVFLLISKKYGAPGAQLIMEITARSLPCLPRVLPLLPRLLQRSIPTKMALIKDLMTPRRMAWNRRRVQYHHLFLRKRIPRTAGSNACLVRSSRLIGVRMCALIWWKASLLAYLSCVVFFSFPQPACLERKLDLKFEIDEISGWKFPTTLVSVKLPLISIINLIRRYELLSMANC